MITRIEKFGDLVDWLECVGAIVQSEQERTTLMAAEDVITALAASQPTVKFKKCRKCGKILPAIDKHFDWFGQSRDGLRYECKSCRNVSRAKDRKFLRSEIKDKGDKATLDELNYQREMEGLLPLSSLPEEKKKRGRPKKKSYIGKQHLPEYGEKW